MYDQNETQTPIFLRILWIALWAILIIVVAWVFIWLLFFRHQDTGKISTDKNQTTQQTSTNGDASKNTKDTKDTQNTPSNNPGTNNTTSPQTSQNSSSAAANDPAKATPTELANTGAGDVLMPFAVATVAGTTLYYIRLRRKLTA